MPKGAVTNISTAGKIDMSMTQLWFYDYSCDNDYGFMAKSLISITITSSTITMIAIVDLYL